MSTEIFKRVRQKYIPITANFTNEIWQVDICFIEVNGKEKKILAGIDIYSRYALAYLLKDKTAESVLHGIRYFIKRMGTPKIMFTDKGGEFKGVVSTYLKNNEIEHRVAEGDGSKSKKIKTMMSNVERLNGTIRYSINVYVELNDKRTITQDELDELMDDYNNRKHRTIGVRPRDVMEHKVKPKQKLYKHNITEVEFKTGDAVRLLIQYADMEKGLKSKPRYTRDVYYIVNRKGYRFKISNGLWYPYTRLMKSKDKVTVFYYKDDVDDEKDENDELEDIKEKTRQEKIKTNLKRLKKMLS